MAITRSDALKIAVAFQDPAKYPSVAGYSTAKDPDQEDWHAILYVNDQKEGSESIPDQKEGVSIRKIPVGDIQPLEA